MIPTRLHGALVALALLTGCPPRVPPVEGPPPIVDPVELLARAAAEPVPGPSAASFDLEVTLPDKHVNAQGALVVVPPDRFRIEVRGPIGGPQVVVVSDGTALTTWLAGKNQVLIEPEADAAIAAYTGGKTGLEALASLLLGRLPPLGPPELVRPDAPPAYRWTGPALSYVEVGLDPRTARLVTLGLVDELGSALLSATVAGKAWPERLEAFLPQQGIRATLKFDEWKPAAPPDSAFLLPPPPGAEVKPLLPKAGSPSQAPVEPAAPIAPAPMQGP